MNELLRISIIPLLITLGAYQIGLLCQKKFKLAVFNPILISMILVILTLKLTDIQMAQYQSGMGMISWMLTPATICLAIPMYQHIQVLKKSLPAILAGITAGAAASLGLVLALCVLFRLDWVMTASLLPKSVTSAISVSLTEMAGGIPSITTAVVIVAGIIGSMCGPMFCKIFRLRDEVAKGVAFGTAAHVIGTTKAAEIGGLCGAVSSLSLVVAGIVTAVLMPLLCTFAQTFFA